MDFSGDALTSGCAFRMPQAEAKSEGSETFSEAKKNPAKAV
jgi:hypothetical protein